MATDGVTILIERDPNVEVASVSVDGRGFMGGKYWNFEPECHGGFHNELAKLHGTWHSAEGLADVIATFLVTKGATM